jgi:hypothetical protein
VSDYYSIQEVGGAELAQHYPDRGVIPQSDYHKAILRAGKQAHGWWRLFAKYERFIATLSADQNGLRVFVALDNFAVFIPWSELTVCGERSTPGTFVRLRAAALPSLDLVMHMDNAAADDLFRAKMAPLPTRDPPGRVYWPKPWATGMLVGLMLVTAVGLASLNLSALMKIAVAAILSVAICMFWHLGRPIFEEKRPPSTSQKKN